MNGGSCEYCYARDIANRFKGYDYHDGEPNVWASTAIELVEPMTITRKNGKQYIAPYPFGFKPTFHRYKLDEYKNKSARNIFVCSMADLFGDWVPDSWIREVFEACEKALQHNYMFLTKNPKRYIELCSCGRLPKNDNFWYGQTITKNSDKMTSLKYMGVKWFFSVEPILSHIDLPIIPDWVIIGAETGRRKDKVVPERKWLDDIVTQCRENGKNVFMKSSLAPIWREQLIQEFPDGLKREG